MAAVVQPRDRLLPRVAPLRERDVRLVEPGLGRQDRVVDLLAPGGDAGLDPDPLELVRAEGGLELRVEHLHGSGQLAGQPLRRRRRRASRCAPPARSRTSRRSAPRSRVARTASPSSGSVSSRKSSGPRRHTRSGAISRALRREQERVDDLAAQVTSFESIRWRRSSASGPATRTYARGREAIRTVETATAISLGTDAPVPVEGGEEGRRGGLRPGPAPAGPVPDREVARPPRGRRAARPTSRPGTSGSSARSSRRCA